MLFPECVASVTVSLWGSGGEAVGAKSCVVLSTVHNRLRESRKALHSGECV